MDAHGVAGIYPPVADKRGVILNKVKNLGILLILSLILIGCHGDPLDTPGYREPLLVGGTIQSDTIWHAVNGPYRVVEDLVIADSVIWQVEAGTEVLVDWNKAIDVQGIADFSGTEQNRIVVRSEQGLWRGFRFEKSSRTTEGTWLAELEYVDIENAVTAAECIDSVEMGFYNCRFLYCDSIGVRAGSGSYVSICDCQFMNDRDLNLQTTTAIWTVNGGGVVVSGTNITGFQYGIRIQGNYYVGGTGFHLQDNFIVDCDIAVICDSQDDPQILDNEFKGNSIAVLINQGFVLLNGNDFMKNTECIHIEGPCTPTAHQNNFISTGQWAWWHASRDSVDATENWWGTTDPDSIATLIYDHEDNSSLGLVQFEPFLTSPRL
jgi:hypothetical protein